jgi:hypothetical protein
MSEPEPQAGEMDKQGSDVDSNGSEVGDSQEIGPVGVDVGASAWQTPTFTPVRVTTFE